MSLANADALGRLRRSVPSFGEDDMSIQEHLARHFSSKRIILVGNALFSEPRAELIDSHDVVVRFNFFTTSSFKSGLTGGRIDYWCVNLRTDKRRQRAAHCRQVRALNPEAKVITPYEEDGHGGLEAARSYYEAHDLAFIRPDSGLRPELRLQPSAGYYLAHRLLSLSIPFVIIGFTGQTSRHHDGQDEISRLRRQPLVTFHETPNQRIEPMTRSAMTPPDQSNVPGALLVMAHPFR